MRITGIYKPTDSLGPDGKPQPEVAALFAQLFPNVENPEIDDHHAGTAIMAHSPALAAKFADLSRFMFLELAWTKRAALRELAFATLHLHFKARYAFESRLDAAKTAGITAEQLAALPYWQNSTLFDDEQKLVIAYTLAVTSGDVPDALASRVIAHFGEQETVEFTSTIGFWSCWSMILNSFKP